MTPSSLYRVDVLRGDCAPDGVVLADSWSRWLDAAAQEHLRDCGVPLWRRADDGVLGALLVETRMRFIAMAEPGDALAIHTQVQSWGHDDIVIAHRVLRGDTLVCEAHETRALCAFDGPGRTHRVAAEAWMPAHCG
jgi:4-hydroxybenzoyl-CoA thioesterase